MLRDHRIAVGIFDGPPGGPLRRTLRAELDVSGPRTEVPELVGRPAGSLILINDDDLGYAKIRFDPGSLATLRAGIGTLDRPLSRAVCWTALTDLLRDAELTPSDWIAVLLGDSEDSGSGGIGVETIGEAVRQLLDQLERVVDRWLPADARPAALARLAARAWREVNEQPAGSDHQLHWWRAFCRVAARGGLGDALLACLRGDRVPPGIDLDLENRWAALRGLVPAGLAGPAEIDGEYARDPNAASEGHAAAARASIPDAAAKEAAWRLVVTDGPVPLRLRAAAADGFWHGPAELVRPYVERYYRDLDTFWALDDGGGQAYVTTAQLAPPLAEQATLDLADHWLARPDRPPVQRRLVLEHREELALALRAQAADAGGEPIRPGAAP